MMNRRQAIPRAHVTKGRGHAAGVWRLGATGLADSVSGNAIEAEGRRHGRAGDQSSLVNRLAYGRRIELLAKTAVGTTLCDSLCIYRMIKNGVYIYEVHSIGYVEALTVRVKPVWS